MANDLCLSILIVVSVLLVGVGLGWENNKIVPVNPTPSAHYHVEPHNHLSFLANWDGPQYLSIAQHGYVETDQANFFPLYPLLIHIVNYFIPSLLYSALIVSWVSFVWATYFYLKIVKKLFKIKDNIIALQGVLFFVLFPTAVFLMATYTEGLFAALSLGSIYFALQKRYIITALFALFATVAHPTGLFLIALIAALLFEEGVKLIKILYAVVLSSIGLLGYILYDNSHFHKPLAFIDAQKAHSWLNFSIGHVLTEFATLNGMFLVLLIISAIYWWKRRKSFSLYSALYVCIVFLGGKGLSGVGRYSLMAFPLQLMLFDYLKDKKLGYEVAIILSCILWTFVTLRYMGGYTGG